MNVFVYSLLSFFRGFAKEQNQTSSFGFKYQLMYFKCFALFFFYRLFELVEFGWIADFWLPVCPSACHILRQHLIVLTVIAHCSFRSVERCIFFIFLFHRFSQYSKTFSCDFFSRFPFGRVVGWSVQKNGALLWQANIICFYLFVTYATINIYITNKRTEKKI